MGHRQKGRGKKRKRSWHRLGNQDAKWRRAVKALERAREHLPRPDTDTRDEGAD